MGKNINQTKVVPLPYKTVIPVTPKHVKTHIKDHSKESTTVVVLVWICLFLWTAYMVKAAIQGVKDLISGDIK